MMGSTVRTRLTKTLGLGLGILALIAGPAAAQDYTVNTTTDGSTPDCDTMTPVDCTLRQAISLAGDNHPGTVHVPAGHYTLDPAKGSITLFREVTVVGASARTTVIDGAH